MVFLPHTNTVILLEPYCGTITEPGLPVIQPQKISPPFDELNEIEIVLNGTNSLF